MRTFPGVVSFLVVLLGFVSGTHPFYAAYAQTSSDGIVAVVGGQPILRSEIMQEIMPQLNDLAATTQSKEELNAQFESLFKEALDQAIEHYLLFNEAKSLGITIPEEEVEKRLNEIRRQYGSTEEFQRRLESAGYTISDLRDRIRRQMFAISLGLNKRRQFEREAVVTEKDMKEYYEQHVDMFRYEERYRIRRIFIQADQSGASRNAAREKLAKLKEEINGGKSFADVAKEHSNGPEAAEGGLMGWIRKGDLVDPLDSALPHLSIGEVSDILETDYGLHLLQMEAIEHGGVLEYEEARKEIEPIIRKNKGEERYRNWINTLRQRSNVRVLI